MEIKQISTVHKSYLRNLILPFSSTKRIPLPRFLPRIMSRLIFFLHLFLCISHLHHLSINGQDDSQTFIVHVSKQHKPSIFQTHRRWYHSLLTSIAGGNTSPEIIYDYEHAAHGFAARLDHAQAGSLRRLAGILSVSPEKVHQLHTTHTPQFLSLTESNGLWPASNFGDDLIIGVLDTGIWPERPSFSDEGLSPPPSRWRGGCDGAPAEFCNNKIIGAKFYSRGYEAVHGRMNVTSRSARDTEGHGTHTASTAAGSAVSNASFFRYAVGEARGMAPLARIAAYKICWSRGCYDSDILAAMDRAVVDGVDVISLSVGATGYAPDFDEDSIAIGAFGAVSKGIIVSCSAGNSGPGRGTAVNIAPWILTVGASTIDREFPADVILGDGSTHTGVSLFSGDPLGETNLPLVYFPEKFSSSLCLPNSLKPAKVAGKIVVCDRGINARVEKGEVVKEAGGWGMILANTEENGEELVADAHLIPATMVGCSAGELIRSYAQSTKPPNATIQFRGTVIGKSPPAPKIAAFSSRGPNRNSPEILKPDVIAPGVNILAAWTGFTGPTDLSIDSRRVNFNIISGTSMSCPHVSGLAGLVKQAHRNWSPAAVKSALMTTSYQFDDSGSIIKDLSIGEESTPYDCGSGHVDPNKAVDPGLVYDIETKDYVSFLCALGYDSYRIAVFTKGQTVDCSSSPLTNPEDLNYPSFSVVLNPELGSKARYSRRVKNVGSAQSTYHVMVEAPEGVEISVSPSSLQFNSVDQNLDFVVTFTSSIIYSEPLIRFGSITWSDGPHHVRSPVVVSWMGSLDIASI